MKTIFWGILLTIVFGVVSCVPSSDQYAFGDAEHYEEYRE